MNWEWIIRVITVILTRVAEAEARKDEIVTIPIKDLRSERTAADALEELKRKRKAR